MHLHKAPNQYLFVIQKLTIMPLKHVLIGRERKPELL